MLKILLICILLIIPSLCVLGLDISDSMSVSTFQCFKTNGYQFVIIRGFRSYGAVDPYVISNINNAKSAGLIADIYMFPCRGKTASSQVDALFSGVPSSAYGMVWIDVENNPSSGCAWGKDYTSNCAYLTDLIAKIKAKGKNPGIYASNYMWETVMGG